MTRVTVWNEYRHEQQDPAIAAVYPQGIHGQIASFLQAAGFTTRTATLDEPEHGLTDAVLNETDVLGNDSNLLIVFYVQIMPDDLVMQLHRF